MLARIEKIQPSDNIIAFPRIRRDVSTVHALSQLWSEIRPASGLPHRGDIKIDDIKSHLKHLFLFDRLSPFDVTIKMHGHGLTALFGHDISGLPLSVIMTPTARLALRDIVSDMYMAQRPYNITLVDKGTMFGRNLKANLALFPLANYAGQATKGIGVLIPEGNIKKKDYRFDIECIN